MSPFRILENPPPEPARAYIRAQIETASHGRLICMLHEQGSYLLRQALGVRTPLRRSLLDRAQNILVVLQRALTISDATSKGLFHLYDYCYCLLDRDGTEELTHAYSIIEGLRDTFDQLQRRPVR